MNTKQASESGASRRTVLPLVRNTATRLVSLGAHVAGSLLAAACNWVLVDAISEGERPERFGSYHESRSGS